jgi:hypothetical protein
MEAPLRLLVLMKQLLFTQMVQMKLGYVHIKLSNIGAYTFKVISRATYGNFNTLKLNFFGSSLAENITSITKINVVASIATAIAAGSRFTLYKLYE